MLFAACNNEDNPTLETGNQPVDVIVSLNTIQVGTRAAMGGLQDKVEDQAAASLEKVHVYLIDHEGNITVAEEFVKNDANWSKLVNTTAVSSQANPGGYKFKNVDKRHRELWLSATHKVTSQLKRHRLLKLQIMSLNH